MFNNIALDVFIGLVFVFLLYSLLATIIQEMIATKFAFRAKVLEKAILRMLEDGKTTTKFPYGDRVNGMLHLFGVKSMLKGKTVAPWFYAHPLMKYLSEDNFYSKPAYISAQNFSKVVMDLLKGFSRPESEAVQSIHESITNGIINKLPINVSTASADTSNPAIKILRKQTNDCTTVKINPNTALFLQSLWHEAGADPIVFKAKLEDWFNDTMERATGWYKRYTRILLFVIGLIVAYVFNVDTIAIHRILSTNKTAREQMVQMAIKNKDNLDPSKVLNENTMQSDSLLKTTYEMVATDALQANDVLGLGRTWKDTCKICKDSLSNTDFNTRFSTLAKESENAKHNIEVLRTTIADSIKALDSIKDANDIDKKIIPLGRIIKNDSTLLKELQINNPDYKRMLILKERCAYISKKREGKWNLYSPNQSGGWETFFGWLITALALTLGAPFWFDLLGKLIKIRGTGASNNDTSANASITGAGDTVKAPSNPSNPLTINVNSNSGEEAVG